MNESQKELKRLRNKRYYEKQKLKKQTSGDSKSSQEKHSAQNSAPLKDSILKMPQDSSKSISPEPPSSTPDSELSFRREPAIHQTESEDRACLEHEDFVRMMRRLR